MCWPPTSPRSTPVGRDPTTTSRSAPDTLIADVLGCCCVGASGVYLFGFISTFSLRDGAVRYTILFYCMLFGLPIVALLDVLMVIVVLIQVNTDLRPRLSPLMSRRVLTCRPPGLSQSAFCACCCTRKRREDMADEAVDKTKLGFQVVIEDDEDIYEEGRRQ